MDIWHSLPFYHFRPSLFFDLLWLKFFCLLRLEGVVLDQIPVLWLPWCLLYLQILHSRYGMNAVYHYHSPSVLVRNWLDSSLLKPNKRLQNILSNTQKIKVALEKQVAYFFVFLKGALLNCIGKIRNVYVLSLFWINKRHFH